MKFWQLDDLCRWLEPGLMDRLGDRPEWLRYLDWHRNVDTLIANGDRERLDAGTPDEACLYVLAGTQHKFYLHGDFLRSAPFDPSDRELTAVEAFRLFGGGPLEEAHEKGSVRVVEE